MKKVVTIGGGTGSFMLLSGLKKYPIELSAIVSMADDGGSTGILRDELGVLPPGDVRQCLVALSESSDMLRDLMNYRFTEGGLKGHSFGNIFLSALEKITGSFAEGVEEAAQILNVKGEVVPVTEVDTTLKVQLKNGKVLEGEHEINTNEKVQKLGIKKAFLEPAAKANKRALQKILEADLIVIGPGNHYCSIVPNLLVKGISEAIRKSKAKVVYNCNLINKRGHTDGFTLDDYVREINGYLGAERIDFATFNTGKPAKKLIEYYSVKDGELVTFDSTEQEERRYRVLRAKLLNQGAVKFDTADKISQTRSFIRHDSERLAKILVMLLELEGYESILKDIV
jgi:uncharacterized cofD-like protein